MVISTSILRACRSAASHAALYTSSCRARRARWSGRNQHDGRGRVDDPADMTSAEMATYEITRIPVDQFFCGELCHTHLADEIAEAKRHPDSGHTPSVRARPWRVNASGARPAIRTMFQSAERSGRRGPDRHRLRRLYRRGKAGRYAASSLAISWATWKC